MVSVPVPLFSRRGSDVLWESALRALPAPLLGALRDADLDDPAVLIEYPRYSEGDLGVDAACAPSGAATSTHSSTGPGTLTVAAPTPTSALPGPAGLVLDVGGDPRNDQILCGLC